MDDWKTLDLDQFNLHSHSYRVDNTPKAGFDPYQIMLNRKRNDDSDQILSDPIISYNKEDILELEKFCKSHNILGLNFKRCNPKETLRILKTKFGYSNIPSNNQNLLLG